MSNNTFIKVSNVSKTFVLPHEKNSSIKNAVINFYKRNKSFEKQKVLSDISFEIKEGDFFGIVGRNGSGKSTLLKLLAGIYTPSKGTISVNGKLTPFIELGVGFNPELSGRENVFLNGALLGFNRKEMAEMYDEIVEFAELERFMDQKLKNYSSGMQVRLAFSIAIRAKGDILLLDEVLAVGDEAFQKKCVKVFDSYKKNNKTVILVTHDMSAVKKYCNKAILIHDGDIIDSGNPHQIAAKYAKLNNLDPTTFKDPNLESSIKIHINNNKYSYENGEKLFVDIEWPKEKRVDTVGLAIYSSLGACAYATNTKLDHIILKKESNSIKYEAELNLGSGDYFLTAGTFVGDNDEVVDFQSSGPEISISSNPKMAGEGIAVLKHKWYTENVR